MSFPNSFDNLSTAYSDQLAQAGAHKDAHNNVNDAVNRMQSAQGLNAQGTYSSVRARLDALEFLVVATQVADYAVAVADRILIGNPAANGSVSFALPTAVGNAGKRYTFKRLSPDPSIVRIVPLQNQPIDNIYNVYSLAAYESIEIISDGTRWVII